MPLRTDDEQAARLADLVGLVGNFGLVEGQPLGKETAGIQDLLAVGLGIAGGLGDQLVGKAGLAQIGGGHILGVSAQHETQLFWSRSVRDRKLPLH